MRPKFHSFPALAAAAIFSSALSAQIIVPSDRAEKLLAAETRTSMECRVIPVDPELDFGFRFLAGYKVRVPFDHYSGNGHAWTAITRIQTEPDKPPVYLLDRVRLPPVLNANANGEAAGGFLLGEGRYRVSFQLIDDQARSCRAEWTIEAKLSGASRKVKLALKPGAIDEISLRSLRSRDSLKAMPQDAVIGNMTVLLHAAPISPRVAKIPPGDAMILLSALSSLMDLAPARSVRLVVFSLDQRKEIYRQEHFTPSQIGRVRQALFNLQLATVDYRQLGPSGSADLLQRLVTEELQHPDPAAAVVFLGPHSRSSENPPFEIPAARGSVPKFFYLEYQSPRRLQASAVPEDEFAGHGNSQDAASRATADAYGDGRFVIPKAPQGPAYHQSPFLASRDSIDYLVSRLKGKKLIVSTPVEFARAMEQIARIRNN